METGIDRQSTPVGQFILQLLKENCGIEKAALEIDSIIIFQAFHIAFSFGSFNMNAHFYG